MILGDSRSKKKAWIQAYKLLLMHYVSLPPNTSSPSPFTFSLSTVAYLSLHIFSILAMARAKQTPKKRTAAVPGRTIRKGLRPTRGGAPTRGGVRGSSRGGGIRGSTHG